jgi:hypothetical protein
VNFILKTTSLIYKKFINFLTICIDYAINTAIFIYYYTISIHQFAQLLILIGSIILIVGILFKNPIDIINNSILGNDGPGMIVAIYYPEKIQEFIRIKNQVVLGLLIMCSGYLILFISSVNYKINLARWLILTFIMAYIFGSLIAGYNRKNVIINWKDNKCRYHCLITDLLDKKIDNTRESLNHAWISFNFIKNALSIKIKSEFKDDQKPSLQEIEILQVSIKQDIENTSLFYYFLKPKRLFKDLFLT